MQHLEDARWHARQARVAGAGGNADGEDYHREAAQEALEAFTAKRFRWLSLDELDAMITTGFDALACNDARAVKC